MFIRPYLFLIAAALAGSFGWAVTASAGESQLYLDADQPVPLCSAAADAAKATGKATPENLAICSQAIEFAKQNRDDLAAAYTNRSVLYIVRAEYGLAMTDSEEALRLNQILPEAIINRGISLRAMGKVGEAIEACTQALALGLSHPEIAYFNRAIAREELGDVKGAYSDYLQASEINPKWDLPRKQLARFNVPHQSGGLG